MTAFGCIPGRRQPFAVAGLSLWKKRRVVCLTWTWVATHQNAERNYSKSHIQGEEPHPPCLQVLSFNLCRAQIHNRETFIIHPHSNTNAMETGYVWLWNTLLCAVSIRTATGISQRTLASSRHLCVKIKTKRATYARCDNVSSACNRTRFYFETGDAIF